MVKLCFAVVPLDSHRIFRHLNLPNILSDSLNTPNCQLAAEK